MIDSVCGLCNGPLRKKRYVQVEGRSLTALCSEECFQEVARALRAQRWAARRRLARRLALGIIFVGAWLTPHQGPPGAPRADRPPPVQSAGPPPLPEGWFGPDWPPTDASSLAALGRDSWIHPLAGPVRRMPIRDSRVFGAIRGGDRASECRNGHCGVDLGGEIYGEHVHAVHDGVVDRVQRAPNPLHGGEFVRLSHRNGTVFTQYFHLAAIPRGLERGVPVKGGDVIGLLGDTGVKESEPHLHFAISIRPAKDWPEKYIDPEPLIALWPLRVPVDGSEAGLVTLAARPGVPLGSMPLIPGRKRKHGKRDRGGSDEAATSERSNTEKAKTTSADDDEPSETDAAEPSAAEE